MTLTKEQAEEARRDEVAIALVDRFLEHLGQVNVSPTRLVYWEQVWAMRRTIQDLE